MSLEVLRIVDDQGRIDDGGKGLVREIAGLLPLKYSQLRLDLVVLIVLVFDIVVDTGNLLL